MEDLISVIVSIICENKYFITEDCVILNQNGIFSVHFGAKNKALIYSGVDPVFAAKYFIEANSINNTQVAIEKWIQDHKEILLEC